MLTPVESENIFQGYRHNSKILKIEQLLFSGGFMMNINFIDSLIFSFDSKQFVLDIY